MKQVLIANLAAGLPGGAPTAELEVALNRIALHIGRGCDATAVQRYVRAAEVALDRIARAADAALAARIEAVWLALDQLYLEGAAYRTS